MAFGNPTKLVQINTNTEYYLLFKCIVGLIVA